MLSWYALHWYGPGLGAAVDQSQPTATGTIKGQGNLRAVNMTVPTAYARPNEGHPIRAVHVTAPTAYARPSGRGRIYAVGKVNELSQDDVSGAINNTVIEGEVTLKEALRLLLAFAQGNATGLESGSPVFKSLDGTKDRIVATYSNGTRTVTARDTT
jgi:hypothetical protein